MAVDHVTFGYPGQPPVLRDFSLAVAPGEHVTLVGRTGAGKSTVLKLLLGLYRPQEGEVRVLGAPRGRHTRRGAPPQLRLRGAGLPPRPGHRVRPGVPGRPSVTAAQVDAALDRVGLGGVVAALPRGGQTPFGEASFSQGQRQLLNVARAIVCDPGLLLLDEVTANLDSATERRVMGALMAASDGRTVVSVSHRLFERQGGRLVRVGPARTRRSGRGLTSPRPRAIRPRQRLPECPCRKHVRSGHMGSAGTPAEGRRTARLWTWKASAR